MKRAPTLASMHYVSGKSAFSQRGFARQSLKVNEIVHFILKTAQTVEIGRACTPPYITCGLHFSGVNDGRRQLYSFHLTVPLEHHRSNASLAQHVEEFVPGFTVNRADPAVQIDGLVVQVGNLDDR
jgi:hypothetical protein